MAKSIAPPLHAPTPLRIFSEAPLGLIFGMDLAVDDQHGAGLGREARLWRSSRESGSSSVTPGDPVAEPEDAVWLQVKIGRAGAGVGLVPASS